MCNSYKLIQVQIEHLSVPVSGVFVAGLLWCSYQIFIWNGAALDLIRLTSC